MDQEAQFSAQAAFVVPDELRIRLPGPVNHPWKHRRPQCNVLVNALTGKVDSHPDGDKKPLRDCTRKSLKLWGWTLSPEMRQNQVLYRSGRLQKQILLAASRQAPPVYTNALCHTFEDIEDRLVLGSYSIF